MDLIPLEILDLIAADSRDAYRAMLAVPRFARSLTAADRLRHNELNGCNTQVIGDTTTTFIRICSSDLRHSFRSHDGILAPAIVNVKDGKCTLMVWCHQGLRHRDDGPAVINTTAVDEIIAESWYQYGLLHRDGGPATITANGTKTWYYRGHIHRDDLPAVIWSDGRQEWYHYGKRHRVGAPAIITMNGCEIWYHYGLIHRIGGPALTHENGDIEYYQYNRRTAIMIAGGGSTAH